MANNKDGHLHNCLTKRIVLKSFRVSQPEHDDLDDGYNVENEILIQTIWLLYTKRYDKYKTRRSYKHLGRSLLLLESVGRVSGLDIVSSGLTLDVEGSFCFFAGDGPGSGFALHLLTTVSLCLFGT